MWYNPYADKQLVPPMYRTSISGEELDTYINKLCGGNHDE